jgi:hypothetical protein
VPQASWITTTPGHGFSSAGASTYEGILAPGRLGSDLGHGDRGGGGGVCETTVERFRPPAPPTFCRPQWLRRAEARLDSSQICRRKQFDPRPSRDRLPRLPDALRIQWGKQKTCICRPFMELAGLEPATSWVRSTRPFDREPACLQRVSGERLECRNISRNILGDALQKDRPASSRPAARRCRAEAQLATTQRATPGSS